MARPTKNGVVRHYIEQHGYNSPEGSGGRFDLDPLQKLIDDHTAIHASRPHGFVGPPTSSDKQGKHAHETSDPTKWHMAPPPAKYEGGVAPIFRDRRSEGNARSDILAEERKERRGW